MKLKSSLTFVSISILVFGMIFATSATQMDKIFAKPIVGENNDFDVSGVHLSNDEKMRFLENMLGAIFDTGKPSSSEPSLISSDKH